ncbi:hypothetical protein P4H66_06170 [Paenibacillus dokdonensis]|uniref:Uncharacterized protein n=1 Tax=Paenibacillus dokdonensis TaxID=2567944 RepID=A0ABU6GL43_9BACL|nr:hypothetical protein [Paenibacillus dokdonensis]MEC0239440.1 hypothetical protein [Paenibacillus dokdonensis]
MISLIPFAELAGVGIVAHVVERKLERAGHGGRVVLVRMATYVICAGIALYQWRIALRMLGLAFGVHVSW